MTLSIGSLFSGIGGLELGLEAAGVGRVAWQVELDPFCRRVLSKHWPDADRSVCDVEDPALFALPRVDVLAGGPPCPDFSLAGKGAGVEGPRGRLIYAYESAVRTMRPPAVVLENVASGAIRWLPHVRLFLQFLDYRTRAYKVSAADVGAPHLRNRIFVVGVVNANGTREPQPQGCDQEERRRAFDRCETLGNTNGVERKGGKRIDDEARRRSDAQSDGQRRVGAEPESGLGGLSDGLPSRVELPSRWPAPPPGSQQDWEPSRTIPSRSQKHRQARLKANGNAVVPRCGYVAGRALLEWMDEVLS